MDYGIKAALVIAPINRGDIFSVSIYERFLHIFTKQMVMSTRSMIKNNFLRRLTIIL